MKTTYKVAVSGWAVVEVEANNADEAIKLVEDNTPGVAGELYDLEVHEAVVAEDTFKFSPVEG
jgi:hypothetical protein